MNWIEVIVGLIFIVLFGMSVAGIFIDSRKEETEMKRSLALAVRKNNEIAAGKLPIFG